MIHFPRTSLAEELAAALNGKTVVSDAPNGLFLAAPRRTGKSTFLQQDLKPMLEAQGAVVVYVDLWSDQRRDPGSLVAEAIGRALQADLGSLKIDTSKIGKLDGATLPDALRALHEAAKAPIALIIDEAQHALTSEAGETAMAALKSARDQLNRPGTINLMLVMSGSDRDKLLRLVNTNGAPFYGSQIQRMPELGADFIDHLARLIERQRPDLKPVDIRQNLDNQKKEFIQPFFSTMQWVMAGNDTEGLRYATIETPEKYLPALGGGHRPRCQGDEPAGTDPRLRRLRRGRQEAVPPEPVFRRQGGAGETDNLLKYSVYAQMLTDWFSEPAEKAIVKADKFEQAVKKKFIDEPDQMKLLIVVDKLLTGFDAPSATYLYIDKQMRDHGLFQTICRVNRLDGDDKEYGAIIDYKDLFKSLEGAVGDYTSGALDGYDHDDVKGLLENRLDKAREDLEEAREAVKALCEPVMAPWDSAAYLHYFCAKDSGNSAQLKDNEPKRLKLYKFVATLIRAYASIASELAETGYKPDEIKKIKTEVDHYSKLRDEVRLASGDYIDLKAYEPAMRHLIDTYIRAEESEKISAFDDMSLIQLIVGRGPDLAAEKIKGVMKTEEAVAETIENNVRKLIINESPVDPAYYDKMSTLLDALIEQRRKGVVSYKEYLEKIAKLTKDATLPGGGPGGYPASLKTAAQRVLYNNLGKDEGLALAVDMAIMSSLQNGWKTNAMKTKRVRIAIREVLIKAAARPAAANAANQEMARDEYPVEVLTDQVLELAKHQNDY